MPSNLEWRAVYDNNCGHLSAPAQPRSRGECHRPSRPKKRGIERSAGSKRFYPGASYDWNPDPGSQHRTHRRPPCRQFLLQSSQKKPEILCPRQKRESVATSGRPSISRFESLLLLNAHTAKKHSRFQHWGESEESHTLPTTDWLQVCGKT